MGFILVVARVVGAAGYYTLLQGLSSRVCSLPMRSIINTAMLSLIGVRVRKTASKACLMKPIE